MVEQKKETKKVCESDSKPQEQVARKPYMFSRK
jgi:hypothetical protein